MENKDFIISKFKEVKSLEYVPSNRANNTGIGKTFEDYIGVVENNLDEPDLAGFEIKSHRGASCSYVTLFTKSPSFPKRANAYLKDKFGTPYEDAPSINSLHTSMFANSYNTYMKKYSFKLLNNPVAKTILIGVFDLNTKELLDCSVGYTYQDIQKALTKKLKNLLYVTAQTKKEGGKELFYFNKADIYTEPSFERFISLLTDGKIMYDIRIGSYKSGPKYGMPHDHGSGFRILEANIRLLYSVRFIWWRLYQDRRQIPYGFNDNRINIPTGYYLPKRYFPETLCMSLRDWNRTLRSYGLPHRPPFPSRFLG